MKRKMGSNLSFFVTLICFSFFLSDFSNTFASQTRHLCRPDQKDALLDFKNEFQIPESESVYPCSQDCSMPYLKTKSWKNSSDCCSWDGVTCDVKSGAVIGLDLSCSCLYGTFKPNSSLFRLNHLRSLDLAYNDFNSSSISSEFSKLTMLTRLNLSTSGFSGQIPTVLLRLTKLVFLDLTRGDLFTEMSFLGKLARNLTNLAELRLSYINLSSTIPHDFANMSSLRSLHLQSCNLFGMFPGGVFLLPRIESIVVSQNYNLMGSLLEFSTNSSLRALDLSYTNFSGSVPYSIGNLKSLNSLILSSTNFSGILPESIGNLTSLKSLNLLSNNFFGEVPSSIGNLNQLYYLSLSDNKFSGNFPLAFHNLSKVFLIDLSHNRFTGPFPSDIGNLSQLGCLSARFDSYRPFSLLLGDSCIGLSLLILDSNNFSGPIPRSISNLFNLQYADLSFFNSSVTIDLSIFLVLKSLKGLSLAGNSVSLANAGPTSDFPLHLLLLDLSTCDITSIPNFLRTQQELQYLDLSNNKIKGQVPNWLWRLPMLEYVNLSHNSFSSFQGLPKVLPAKQIIILDLSSNSFRGPFPIPPPSTQYLLASDNYFTGNIPWPICRLSTLQILDLSKNNFSGSIPRCFRNFSDSLSIISLRSNSLSGSLPETFAACENLQTLDVGHNRLTGKLPKSLTNCTNLEVLNVESNRFNDTFPFWLEALQELQVLVLRSNEFHGPMVSSGFPNLKIIDISHNNFVGTLPSGYFANWSAMSSIKENVDSYYLQYAGGNLRYYSMVLMIKGSALEFERILTIYTAIDFSGNKFRGQIPESIRLLKELIVLNFSNNAFTSHIPQSFANLTKLESLDLSQNRLSGKIPPELGSLSRLGRINFSHNQFTGEIPQGPQFQTQDSSSFEGNPGLCGRPLQKTCGDVSIPPAQSNQPLDHKEEALSWIAAAIGYMPGLVFGLTIGYIMTSYKQEMFMKVLGQNRRRLIRTR